MHVINKLLCIILSFTFIFVSSMTFLVSEVKTKQNKQTNLKSFLVICSINSVLEMELVNFYLWNYLCFVFTFESLYYLAWNSSLAVILFFQHFTYPTQLPSAFICFCCWEASFSYCCSWLILYIPFAFVFRNFTMMYLIRISLHFILLEFIVLLYLWLSLPFLTNSPVTGSSNIASVFFTFL